ncbi:hypothetical protein FH972_022002 [Carpinus fangiana]|uniref:Mannan endo-1,6-alpha-mannosidase n=1 Tax=Carpinus fangiana TaxID=176857 RepID=A0A5N6KQZ1_9ROSI|nr:hypothetical protein FH972_022002 [Carpinus fangiana]
MPRYPALAFAALLLGDSLLCHAGVVAPRQDSADVAAFKDLDSTYNTLQSAYFDGTTWVVPLQWQQAVTGTLVDASLESYTAALQKYGGIPTTSSTLSVDDGKAFIEKQYGDVLTYYNSGEQVEQIYNDAYDDVQWVILEWLEAIKFVNKYNAYSGGAFSSTQDIAAFAHRAHQFYDRVSDKFDTSLCDGGLTWNPTLATYKNAITNQLFVSASVGMYLYFPGDSNTSPYSSTPPAGTNRPDLTPISAQDPSFLDNAKKEYDWIMSHNFTNAQGLYTDGFHISDGQTSCDQRDEAVYTYNQGVILSGMRGLWEATGDTSYLADGYNLINTVISATGNNAGNSDFAGLGRSGIMEDICDADASCSQDSQSFKGIYFHHLTLFCESLPTDTALVPGVTFTADAATAATHKSNCQDYAPWVAKNAAAALSTRNGTGIFGGWWGENQSAAAGIGGAAAAQPAGAQDYRNHPEILTQAPWVKEGGGQVRMARRDINDGGLGRTEETQLSGLGVVRANWEFLQI